MEYRIARFWYPICKWMAYRGPQKARAEMAVLAMDYLAVITMHKLMRKMKHP